MEVNLLKGEEDSFKLKERVINVGIASFGMSGEVFHAPIINSLPDYNIKKIVERKSYRSSRIFPQVEVVRSFEDLLKDDEIDLVVVNTPNQLHFEMAKAALEAGKHVVVEKPFTVTHNEAVQLDKIAIERGKVLSIFQNRRWDGDFLTVQKIVKEKLLGQLVDFESNYDRFRNYIEKNTWKEESKEGTGLLYNLGSHLIDQAYVLFGMPKAIRADIRTIRPGGMVDDQFEIVMYYDEVRVVLRSSYLVREPRPKYMLHGTLGSYVKYGLDPQEEALKKGGNPSAANWGKESEEIWGILNTEVNGIHFRGKIETIAGSYQAFYQNVYDSISDGTQLAVTASQAADVIRIIEMAQESNSKEKKINIL
jgi:scyllo-inositol 2-dehydrogenase (NADP+)